MDDQDQEAMTKNQQQYQFVVTSIDTEEDRRIRKDYDYTIHNVVTCIYREDVTNQ